MKSYVLDTCAFIYALGIDKRAQTLQNLIDANEVFISVVNLWEIAIKMEKGKLKLGLSLKDLAEKGGQALNGILSIETDDILIYREIMLKTKHRDPFDLMLLAQAQTRSLSIITSDQILLKEFKRNTKAI